MARVLLSYALTVLTLISHAGALNASGAGALERLLRQIPANAGGMVSLADLDAARRQMQPMIATAQPDQRPLFPFTAVSAPGGFNAQSIHFFENGSKAELGFSVFDIRQMAGWGNPPKSPVIVTGVSGKAADIGAALTRRGFAEAQRGGNTIWHLQDDFEINLERRNTDPFTHQLGISQRFAIDGDTLFFARSWAMIETMLAHRNSLADDVDSAAILRAAYMLDGVGDPNEVLLFKGQGPRLDTAALLSDFAMTGTEGSFEDMLESIPGMDLPGLPPFTRYGLLAWQDGATLTGAIAIPYYSAETAGLARDRFNGLLPVVVSALRRSPLTSFCHPNAGST